MTDSTTPVRRVFGNRLGVDASGRSQQAGEACFRQPNARVRFHGERQDTSSPGWRRLLELIDEAVVDSREVFRPLVDLTPAERADLVTLPPSIAGLTRVRHLVLYGSPLVRIPPEVAAMASLEVFEPYTSYGLHWFPFELTKWTNLRSSTVSTRAVYGNYKYRYGFPQLQPEGSLATVLDRDDLDPQVWGTERIRSCSVCDGPIEPARFRQVWISLRVASEVLPLLVNACSEDCVRALPAPPEGYVAMPHRGGRGIHQPEPSYDLDMLGVHYAVTAKQERALLAAAGADGVGEHVEELGETWSDDELSVDTDKAWDAIHRCLGDGTLDPDGADYPLSHAVLGGRHLHDDYYVVYISAAETGDVAAALLGVDRAWLRRRFDAIDDPDYAGAHDDTDFEYTWTNFVDVRAFYQRAAAAGRAVIFTAM